MEKIERTERAEKTGRGSLQGRDQMHDAQPNLPEKKFRVGPICATVWNNTTQRDGVEREYKTISFERGYQDKAGNWKSTSSLRVADIPKAELVLKKAYEYIMLADKITDKIIA